MLNEVIAATHSTTPWYFAVPILIVVCLAALARRRAGGRGGPFSKGPFNGPSDG